MTRRFFKWLERHSVRREWVANRADPTQVVSWAVEWHRIKMSLTCSWGVEAQVWYRRRKLHRSYDARLFKWVANGLEDAYTDRVYGPMGDMNDNFHRCPTCGALPGDGAGCTDPQGCGYGREMLDQDQFTSF